MLARPHSSVHPGALARMQSLSRRFSSGNEREANPPETYGSVHVSDFQGLYPAADERISLWRCGYFSGRKSVSHGQAEIAIIGLAGSIVPWIQAIYILRILTYDHKAISIHFPCDPVVDQILDINAATFIRTFAEARWDIVALGNEGIRITSLLPPTQIGGRQVVIAYFINSLMTIVVINSVLYPLEFQRGLVGVCERRLAEYFTQIEPYRAPVLSFELLLAGKRTAAGVPMIYVSDTYLTRRRTRTLWSNKIITYTSQGINTDFLAIPSIVRPTTKRRPSSETLQGWREGNCHRR